MSNPRNAWRLKKALGRGAQVQLLDDSYHMIHVDKERDLVASLIGGFFDDAVGAKPSAPEPAAERVDA
jgi:carboxylesterase